MVEEVVVIDKQERFDSKRRGYIGVVNLQEIVAVHGLTAGGQVGRSAVDDGIGTVEAADDEFVVYLMPGRAGNLAEGRRQNYRARLAGHEDAAPRRGLIQIDAIGGVGDAVAVESLGSMKSGEGLVNGRLAACQLHDGENDAALGRGLLLIDAIANAIQDLGDYSAGMRRECNTELGRGWGLRHVGLSGGGGCGEGIGRPLCWSFCLAQNFEALLEDLGVLGSHGRVFKHENVVGIDVESGDGEIGRASKHADRRAILRNDKDFVVGEAIEAASTEIAGVLGLVLKLVNKWNLQWSYSLPLLGMRDVEAGVIENDPDAALGREFEKDSDDVGLIKIVGEDLQREAGIRKHRIENIEDLLAGGGAHPGVNVGISDGLPRSIRTSLGVGIELERTIDGDDARIFSEVPGECLRLHVAAGEAEGQI